MRRVYQARPGDCFRACVASIFEVKLVAVPDFMVGAEIGKLLPTQNKVALSAWLGKLGFSYVEFGFQMSPVMTMEQMYEMNGHVTYLLTGLTNQSETHTVVCRGANIVHDPAQDLASSHARDTVVLPCRDGFTRVGFIVLEKPQS